MEGDGRGKAFEGRGAIEREREREDRVTGYLFGQAKYFSPPDVLRC